MGVETFGSHPFAFRYPSQTMERPGQFAHFRYVGDKRSQVVYDVDSLTDEAAPIIGELMESKRFQAFGPDTLDEARNRCYTLYTGPAAGPGNGVPTADAEG